MKLSKLFLGNLQVIMLFYSQFIIIDEFKSAEQSTTTAENQTELELAIAEEIISPLVSSGEEHGRLYQSPYNPEHHLYPVRIISIDGWDITDETFEQDLLLAVGDHQMRVVPDFSNIQPQFVFMSSSWQEKHVSFSIKNNQEIAVGARLIDREYLEWQVQLYGIEVPLDDDSVIDMRQ